jgi:hypothetical protein
VHKLYFENNSSFQHLHFASLSTEASDLLKEASSHPSDMVVEISFVKEGFNTRNIEAQVINAPSQSRKPLGHLIRTHSL